MLPKRLYRSLCAPVMLTALVACESAVVSPESGGGDLVEHTGAASQNGKAPGPRVPVLNLADFSEVGSARVVRTQAGVSVQLKTTGLEPGHAYTLWFVVFNNTDGCLHGTPGFSLCGPADVVNSLAEPDMMYTTGHVVGGSGKATFSGHFNAGSDAGSVNGPVGMPSYGLSNPLGAEYHLAVHDHGPKLSEYMPDMTQSLDGGCTDAGVPEPGVSSPWNDHSGFGRRGPNTCRTVQISIHSP